MVLNPAARVTPSVERSVHAFHSAIASADALALRAQPADFWEVWHSGRGVSDRVIHVLSSCLSFDLDSMQWKSE
jgi:hypothetical protein